jgi:DNA-binding MarR family transcriptional regulator
VRASWGFLTNHALVLVYVITHPESTVREIALGIGVTERATLAIIRELEDGGIVERHRDGRRNTYSVNFASLVSYRREATAGFTPAPFVEAMVRTLATLIREQSVAQPMPSQAPPIRTGTFGFFTNHLVVLLAIALDREATVREIAAQGNMTERAAVTILKQLDDAGVIRKTREGRRNTYDIDYEAFGRQVGKSGGTWELPAPLSENAVAALRALAPAKPLEKRPRREAALV